MSPIEITSVWMARPDFENIPRYDLSPEFHYRLFRRGEEETWARLLYITGMRPDFETAMKQWRFEFEPVPQEMEKRCIFVETQAGEVIATTLAWYEGEPTNEWGRIHWVGVDPAYQGKRIGKALISEALARMSKTHTKVMLETESHRLPAIQMYLDFGFAPQIRGESDKAAWAEIGKTLQLPSQQTP